MDVLQEQIQSAAGVVVDHVDDGQLQVRGEGLGDSALRLLRLRRSEQWPPSASREKPSCPSPISRYTDPARTCSASLKVRPDRPVTEQAHTRSAHCLERTAKSLQEDVGHEKPPHGDRGGKGAITADSHNGTFTHGTPLAANAGYNLRITTASTAGGWSRRDKDGEKESQCIAYTYGLQRNWASRGPLTHTYEGFAHTQRQKMHIYIIHLYIYIYINLYMYAYT